ncbi:flagellar basal body P-ring protein FlgI [Vibrio lentus]|nr:flagellar basal body P-ring protein FlgI [Vibrio lentus]
MVGNNPNVGIISSGSNVRTSMIPTPFGRGDYITFNLIQSDFTTAQRLADAVNNFLGPQNGLVAVDATSVKVRAPRETNQPTCGFPFCHRNTNFDPAEGSAKIIVNSRTGTILWLVSMFA